MYDSVESNKGDTVACARWTGWVACVLRDSAYTTFDAVDNLIRTRSRGANVLHTLAPPVPIGPSALIGPALTPPVPIGLASNMLLTVLRASTCSGESYHTKGVAPSCTESQTQGGSQLSRTSRMSSNRVAHLSRALAPGERRLLLLLDRLLLLHGQSDRCRCLA